MPYRFGLRAVLQVRERAAELEEQTLSRILAEIVRLRAALERTEAELRENATARAQALAAAPLAAMHLHIASASADGMRFRRSELLQQIEVFEGLRIRQVERCTEAYRSRELLRSLRDEGQASWHAAEQKREAKAADEAFLARRARELRAVALDGRK